MGLKTWTLFSFDEGPTARRCEKKKKTGFCPKGQVYFLWDIKAKLAGENKARD